MNKTEYQARLFRLASLIQDSLFLLAQKAPYGEKIRKIRIECISPHTEFDHIRLSVPYFIHFGEGDVTETFATLDIRAMQPTATAPEEIRGVRVTSNSWLSPSVIDRLFAFPQEEKEIDWLKEIAHTAVVFSRWCVESDCKSELKEFFYAGKFPGEAYIGEFLGQPT